MDEKEEKDKVPASESAERPWMSNDKVQFDNMISHCKRMDALAEQSVQDALKFREKADNLFLSQVDERHKHHQENNRFTADYLYNVYPAEAVGVIAIAKALQDLLEKDGLTVKKKE